MRLSSWLWMTLLFPAVCGIAGCGHAQKKYERATSDLTDSVKLYNDNLKWGYPDRAALFVEPARASAFLARAAETAKKIKYTDVKIGPVDFPKDSSEATVTVTRTFYRLDDLTERSEVVTQHWVRKGLKWWIDPEGVPAVTTPEHH